MSGVFPLEIVKRIFLMIMKGPGGETYKYEFGQETSPLNINSVSDPPPPPSLPQIYERPAAMSPAANKRLKIGPISGEAY